MLTFKEFLFEGYKDISDLISTLPNDLQVTLQNLMLNLEPDVPLKVVDSSIFQLPSGRKKNITTIKTSKNNVIKASEYFNITPKVSNNHLNFLVQIDDYLVKFVETGNLKFSENAKTALQEIGVLLYLDGLTDPLLYKKSHRLFLGSDLVQETLNFLQSDPLWNLSCKKTAEKILKFFNANDFELHHQSEVVKKIRAKGKMLSKLSPDKWNPSDIYLIKNSSNVLNDLTEINDILSLNDYISKSGNVVGISLKKSGRDALHGSVALERVNKDLNLGLPFTVLNDLDEVKKRIRINLLSLQNSKISNLLFITKSQSKNLTDEIQKMMPESGNFFKSFPLGVEFLTRICNGDYEKILKYAYLSANSSNVLSCSYYKASSDGVKIVQNEDIKFKLERILIPINGETNVIFIISVDNKKIKLQLRSKGTRPLFNIIYTEPKKDLGINIKKFKF